MVIKTYEEALERAIKIYQGKYAPEKAATIAETLLSIFPELKEGEDERIKNCIGMCLTDASEQRFKDYNTNLRDCLTWLEKQGSEKDIHLTELKAIAYDDAKERMRRAYNENRCSCSFISEIFPSLNLYEKKDNKTTQGKTALEAINEKPVDNANKVRPKPCEGDFIKHNKANLVYKVLSVNSGSCYAENIETGGRIELFNIEQIFHIWTLYDAKDGEVLVSSVNQPFIYNGKFNSFSVGGYYGLDSAGTFVVNSCVQECNWTNNKDIKPADKKQRDLLFQKIQEAGYEWDPENKQLTKLIIVI